MRKAHLFLKKKSPLYEDWHKHKAHSFLHFVIFTTVCVLIFGHILNISLQIVRNNSLIVAQVGPAVSSRENKIKALNERIFKKISEYENTTDLKEKELIKRDLEVILRERLVDFKQDFKNNQKAVQRVKIPKNIKDKLPKELLSLVEDEVEIQGEVIVSHGDDFDGKREELLYEVKDTKTNKQYKLNFENKNQAKNLKTGNKVKIKGVALDQEIVPEYGAGATDSETLPTGVTVTSTSTTEAVANNQKTLVILTNFTNDTRQSWTKEQVQEKMFGTSADSVASYYRTVSNNNTTVSGDVVGWVTIDYQNTGCDISSTRMNWAYAAEEKARQLGFNPSNYNRISYVFPDKTINRWCTWAGWGTYGGTPARTWIFGYNDSRLYIHEHGHNYGMNHAHTLDCGSSQIASSCTSNEYGDNYDPMGNTWTNLVSFNAAHLIEKNWIPTSGVQTITASGIYKISPLFGTGGVKALRLTKADTAEYYIVSYRQPMGRDGLVSGSVTGGIGMHIWNGRANGATRQVPLTPGDGNRDNDVLQDGSSFTDSANNIVITQISRDSAGVTVSVSLNGQTPTVTQPPATQEPVQSSCARNNPVITVSPTSKEGAPGSVVRYILSITNKDSVDCQGSAFNIGASIPSGWTSNLLSPSVTLNPGSSASVNLDVTSSSGATTGTQNINITVSDSSGNHNAVSISASYVVYLATPTTSCIRNPMTITVSPLSRTSDPGINSTYSVMVKNNDSGPCSGISARIGTVLPTQLRVRSTSSLSPSSTISPGGSASATVTVYPISTAKIGEYGFKINVTDTTSLHVTQATDLKYIVTDNQKPTINMSVGIRAGSVNISSTASDINGIEYIKIIANGTTIKECLNVTSCSVTWITSGLSKSQKYTVETIAADKIGNIQNSLRTISIK